MRKLILVVAALVCSGVWAFAQTSSTSGQSMNSGSANGASKTVTGCLTGSAGNYMIKDKANGTTYNLTGDATQLDAHANQEVSVTGTAENGSEGTSGSSSTATSSSGSMNGTSSTSGGESLHVTSVTKIASTCSGT